MTRGTLPFSYMQDVIFLHKTCAGLSCKTSCTNPAKGAGFLRIKNLYRQDFHQMQEKCKISRIFGRICNISMKRLVQDLFQMQDFRQDLCYTMQDFRQDFVRIEQDL